MQSSASIVVRKFGELAQLVERVVRNDEVRGSTPLLSTLAHLSRDRWHSGLIGQRVRPKPASAFSMFGSFQDHLRQQLSDIRAAGLYKSERVIASPQRARIKVADGREIGRAHV